MNYHNARTNREAVYHIQEWINENAHKNDNVVNLWANGIASCIDRSTTIDQELSDNGCFTYETGLRCRQGSLLVIRLYHQHFDYEIGGKS